MLHYTYMYFYEYIHYKIHSSLTCEKVKKISYILCLQTFLLNVDQMQW